MPTSLISRASELSSQDAQPVSVAPLTPLSFLKRAAVVFPHSPAVAYGSKSLSYRELVVAVEKRSTALRNLGVCPGDRVAIMMPNTPEMLFAHFSVPLMDAILVPVNTRLAPEEVQYILDHSGSKVLIVDAEYFPEIAPIIQELPSLQSVCIVPDPQQDTAGVAPVTAPVPGVVWFEEFVASVAESEERFSWTVDDENGPISINYTSGTTGKPKGVVYSHRGAYLNAMNQILHSGFNSDSVYLCTLPMFHCNGWCTPWALVAVGGLQICLRYVRGDAIWNLFNQGVTHLNGAPTVVNMIKNAKAAHGLPRRITITSGGAPLSPRSLEEMESLGFSILHIYGLTETYGPYSVCQPQPGWLDMSAATRASIQARQGVQMVLSDRLRVVTIDSSGSDTLLDVPADGVTMGEVMMRGNTVMTEYFRDDAATKAAFSGGWFHSGDLGVMHSDGYIELRDRSKDIIISGGENISTIELEHAIAAHPDVLEVAVIGIPDEHWGERPKAFITTRHASDLNAESVRLFLTGRISKFKIPSEVAFVEELPKTGTGKVQKFVLRAGLGA